MKVIRDFHLDMLEHDGYLVAQGCDRQDHPHAPLDAAGAKRYMDEGFPWVEGSNSTDVSDHATRAYYEIQAALRQAVPGPAVGDLQRRRAHGGFWERRARGLLFHHRCLRSARQSPGVFRCELRAAAGHARDVCGEMADAHIENFRYMLRSGMMGWFTLMQDSTAWSNEQHEVARAEFALYKNKLRPLDSRGRRLSRVSNGPMECIGMAWSIFVQRSEAGYCMRFADRRWRGAMFSACVGCGKRAYTR